MILKFLPNSIRTSITKTFILAIAGLMITLAGCSTTEIQIIDQPAITPAITPEAVQAGPAAILKIRIGETEPIRSLDPLFALTESAKRLTGLIYEGLVQYDATGKIAPLIASSWTVSDDSLRYTFILNQHASFQDSPQFIDGKGRRVVAADVKAAFTRMTMRLIPPDAVNNFSDIIQGMDAYNRERRELHFPEQHSLSEIRGIVVENDSTVIFNLTEPDPAFLDALASPFGFITPREFTEPHHQRPVGSGPYRLDRRQSDTLFVLQLDQAYWNKSDEVNRPGIAEVRWFRSESAILSAFRRNEIDIIPDISPVMRLSLTDSEGSITTEFLPEANFITTAGNDRIELRFNNRYRQSAGTHPNTLFQNIDADSLATITSRVGIVTKPLLPTENLHADAGTELQRAPSQTPNTLAFFENSYEGYISRILFQAAEDRFPLALVKTGVQSREITWYARYINSWQHSSATTNPYRDPVLAVFVPSRMAAIHQKLAGIQFNNHPWWLRLDGIHLDYSVPLR
jgi:hypothetical protein